MNCIKVFSTRDFAQLQTLRPFKLNIIDVTKHTWLIILYDAPGRCHSEIYFDCLCLDKTFALASWFQGHVLMPYSGL